MSEAGFSPRWASAGFLADRRFAASPPAPPTDPADTVAALREQDFAEGFARGFDEARAEAEQRALAQDQARAAIELAICRMDETLAEELREKLRATVQALCEASILPATLDMAALAARVEKAVAMFMRAQDERVVCLHPDDIPLVQARLPDTLQLRADPAIERGALRIETAQGGVEDGPAQWRRAIAAAIDLC